MPTSLLLRADEVIEWESECRLMADFVAEVGDDKSVAAGANFLS
jgi:hypothetical protein